MVPGLISATSYSPAGSAARGRVGEGPGVRAGGCALASLARLSAMDADFGVDLAAIIRVVNEADVFVVRFALIDQRLLVDARPDDRGLPYIRVVPPASSAEERYRYLQRERPTLPLPEQITVFQWPANVQALRETGVWEQIEQRLVGLGGEQAGLDVQRAYADAQRLERADVLAAIHGGEGYETIWERDADE
jgi:hypothetical protein